MRGMVDVAVAVVSFVDVGQFVSLAFVGMLMFPTGHSWDTRSHISFVFSTLYSFHFFLGQFVLICRYILSISTNPYIHCYVRIIFHSSVSTYPISSSPPLYCVAILSLSLHFFFSICILALYLRTLPRSNLLSCRRSRITSAFTISVPILPAPQPILIDRSIKTSHYYVRLTTHFPIAFFKLFTVPLALMDLKHSGSKSRSAGYISRLWKEEGPLYLLNTNLYHVYNQLGILNRLPIPGLSWKSELALAGLR